MVGGQAKHVPPLPTTPYFILSSSRNREVGELAHIVTNGLGSSACYIGDPGPHIYYLALSLLI